MKESITSINSYRIKSAVIKAIKVSDALYLAAKQWAALPEWLSSAYEKGDIVFGADHIIIRSDFGITRAWQENWIICDSGGELHSCKPGVFEATFEVEEEPETEFYLISENEAQLGDLFYWMDQGNVRSEKWLTGKRPTDAQSWFRIKKTPC